MSAENAIFVEDWLQNFLRKEADKKVKTKNLETIATENAKFNSGDEMKDYGRLIKIARQSMREQPNQTEFAKMMGVGKATVVRWETNQSSPTMKEISKMSNITGQSVGFFFGKDSLKISN